MLNKRKRNLFITTIVFLSIILDQISKIWVRNNFESYIENSIIGDVFTLINVENTGAFLGMGSELSEIPRVLNGLGISVLSTPKGVVSNKVARELKVGGELLCNVW